MGLRPNGASTENNARQEASMLRQALSAALVLAALAAAAPALAMSDSSNVYFWEDSQHFGWSYYPYPSFGAPAPALRRPISLSELCARQVGRVLRVDAESMVRATQMTDQCIANRGRL